MPWRTLRSNGPAAATALVINHKFKQMLVKILSHPLAQCLSFCFILTGSPYFGGPYVYFLYHAVQEKLLYAVTGWAGITCTLLSLLPGLRRQLQLAGLGLMAGSLLLLAFSSQGFMAIYAWTDLVPALSLLLFISIAATVVWRWGRRKAV